MKYPDFSHIDFQDLKFFIAIAELGSMTAAANRLYVSQPLLSKRLSVLEQAIGIQLFVRRRKRLLLTPEGEHLLYQAKDILSQFERAVEEAGSISANHYKRLVVGLMGGNGVGEWKGTRLIQIIRDYFSQLDVEILVAFSYQEMNEWFHNREIDVLITEERCFYKTDQDIEVAQIGYTRPAVMVGAGHPLSGRANAEVEELRDAQFLFYRGPGSELYDSWVCHMCEKHRFTPNVIKYFPNAISAVHNLVGSQAVMLTTMNSFFGSIPGLELVELNELPIPVVAIWWKDLGPLSSRLGELFHEIRQSDLEERMTSL